MNATTSSCRRRLSGRLERGFASVEFALLSVFLIVPLCVAVIDFGQIMHTKYILMRASEAGVMAAAAGQNAEAVVRQYVTGAGKDVNRLTVTATSNYQSLPIGSTVAVTATYSLTGLPIIPWEGMIPSLAGLSATATARHQ